MILDTNNDLLYQIALSITPGVGPAVGRYLLDEYKTARDVFNADEKELYALPGVNDRVVAQIKDNAALKVADKELNFIEKHGIDVYGIDDNAYPRRLKRSPFAPLVLFGKGLMDLNAEKMISVVGTRRVTPYGREMAQQLIKDLAPHNVTVISGLALGVDITAHRSALNADLQTVAALAHGLDRVYPAHHREEAKQMLKHGGLITYFTSGTNPDKGNFPDRNRIIAGISDATVVVESRLQGGSMITAELAASYNRDVFAFPGKAKDLNSTGCNLLIKSHRAALIEDARDLEYQMGWQNDVKRDKRKDRAKSNVQRKLFVELSPEEEKIMEVLKEKEKLPIDEIGQLIEKPAGAVSLHLFNLEMNGLVKALPGKVYQLN